MAQGDSIGLRLCDWFYILRYVNLLSLYLQQGLPFI